MTDERTERIDSLRADLREVVLELQTLYATLKRDEPDLSQAEFARRHLPFDSTVWSKLQSTDTPYDSGHEAKIAQCRQAVADIEERLATANLHRGEGKVVPLRHFRDVENALAIARTVRNENRLVVFLAPTGGSKSALCRHLAVTRSAVLVEAKASWSGSYFATCLDVCAALGVRSSRAFDYRTNKRAAETKMLAALRSRDHLLCFDEGATSFSVHTAAAVKLILNQTRARVLMCGTPELLDRMMASSEGRQLIRRCVCVVRAEVVSARDVRQFLVYDLDQDAVDLVVQAANDFGLYDHVTRVAEVLQLDHKPGAAVPADAVRSAVKLARRQVGKV
jgi:type II secretory pathway predicted ATPase ExeA